MLSSLLLILVGLFVTGLMAKDTVVAFRDGYVLLGRARTRRHYRTDGRGLFLINVIGNALVLVMGLVTVCIGAWGLLAVE